MDDFAHRLIEDIKSYLSLKHDFLAMTTEEKTIEYWDSLLKNLHYLPKYFAKLFLPLMNEYKILRQVCRHLGDFCRLIIKGCITNKTTEYLFKFGTYKCSSKIASLLLEIIPVELEVLYICTSKVKESRSTELEGFVKQILKASPRILQNYLILLQGRMSGAVAVNALTQSIYIMMEFLLIFYTDIPKRFIHRDKLNDMLAHLGVLTREIYSDVAYKAEHVINSILVRDNSLSHLIFSLPSIIDKIKLIVVEVTRLQPEDKNGDPLDAKSSDETIGSTSSPLVEVIVGLEEEVNWIIDQLFDEQAELDVISIVGMPGLGKTTLANKVYNNTLVASRFKVRAWCTVSQKYKKSKVLQKILNQVTGFEEKECGDDIAEKLRGPLYDRRYLIILDDVWDIATGEMLISCFPKVERGNRIILTSRNSKVALQLKFHSDPFHLQLLTPEKKVFGEGNCPELSDVGHQIVDKCQGLPLAVVLIAGVIFRMKGKKKDSWHKIQHNLDSFISGNNLQTMKVMQLSYEYLPDHLKPLLLYFGGARKRKRTPVYKLIQLLMAEGFVDHIPSKSSLEETTQSYLDALISSSLIMVSEKPVETSPFYIKVKVCYVPDVVHDFCSVKVKKETFFKFINSGAPVHASDFINRHVTIHTEGQLHKKCVVFNSNKSSGTESSTNLRRIAASPDGLFLLAIDEINCCQFINLPRRTVLHRITFKHPIADAKFRPNGKFMALAAGQKDVIVGVFLGTDKKINKVCKVHTVSRDGTIFTWGCNEMDGNNGEPESPGTPEQGQGNNEEGDSDKIVKKRKNFDGKYGVRS
ncbi:hypothetical protein BC332_13086 [Capsicum chinense]|nr:hypothetical protein BC332_13086 [Capsicum chinense]